MVLQVGHLEEINSILEPSYFVCAKQKYERYKIVTDNLFIQITVFCFVFFFLIAVLV